MAKKVESDQARFWRHVDRNGPVPPARPDLGPCWLWLGSDIRGYGQFSVGSRPLRNRGQVKAHRFAYADMNGPIPDGLTLDHLCRIRRCVNPAHLEPVTSRVNVLRGDTVVARNAAKTLCSHGHPFDAIHNGHRVCLICNAAAQARYRASHGRPPITDQLRTKNREYMQTYRARKSEEQRADERARGREYARVRRARRHDHAVPA